MILIGTVSVVSVTFILTLSERLAFSVAGSPVEGLFPFLSAPLVQASACVAAGGLVLISRQLLLLLHSRPLVSPEARFRYRRVREMLVCSILLLLSSLVALSLFIFIATNRFSLVASSRYTFFLNLGYGFAEVTWACTMLFMMGSLFLAAYLSQKCCGGGKSFDSLDQEQAAELGAPLLTDMPVLSDSGTILHIPRNYDV